MNRVGADLKRRSWVDPVNVYRTDPVAVLAAHFKTHPPTVQADQVEEYVAASSVLHACDGWAVLGRSVSALIHGHPTTAIHLAYYSELRAAMAILATQGVGIFDGSHAVVTRRGVAEIRGRTHDVTWDALESLLQDVSVAVVIAPLITAAGRGLEEWLDALSPGLRLEMVLTTWLQRCGIDASRSRLDRRSRNDSSYRPDGVNPRRAPAVSPVADFVRDVWNASEPTISPFHQISRHFVRIALEMGAAHLGLTGARRTAAIVGATTAMIDAAGRPAYLDFMLRVTESDDHPLITLANRPSGGRDQEALEMGARSTLLLGLATLLAGDLLRLARFGPKETSFWWRSLGYERGLWVRGRTPVRPADSWMEIQQALDDLEKWQRRLRGRQPSRGVLLRDLGTTLATLTGCERVALWGLIL